MEPLILKLFRTDMNTMMLKVNVTTIELVYREKWSPLEK